MSLWLSCDKIRPMLGEVVLHSRKQKLKHRSSCNHELNTHKSAWHERSNLNNTQTQKQTHNHHEAVCQDHPMNPMGVLAGLPYTTSGSPLDTHWMVQVYSFNWYRNHCHLVYWCISEGISSRLNKLLGRKNSCVFTTISPVTLPAYRLNWCITSS